MKRRREGRGHVIGSLGLPGAWGSVVTNQDNLPTPAGYAELLVELKERIRRARIRAGLAVNRELVMLYWHIGREILTRQEEAGLGGESHRRLADDLRREFPDMKGLHLVTSII